MRQNSAAPNGNNRRSFLKGSLAAVAGASALSSPNLLAQSTRRLTNGDAAILKFLAAAELIEADLWQQYAELGGVTTGSQNAYQMAFQQLDPDGSQYITSWPTRFSPVGRGYSRRESQAGSRHRQKRTQTRLDIRLHGMGFDDKITCGSSKA